MKEIEPGHRYYIHEYPTQKDSGFPIKQQKIQFVKKIGEKFPGNQGEETSGTNCQELIRVLIARCKYLNNQIPCEETNKIISHLRKALVQFENRALRMRGLQKTFWPLEIENLPPCRICGHIYPHNNTHPEGN